MRIIENTIIMVPKIFKTSSFPSNITAAADIKRRNTNAGK